VSVPYAGDTVGRESVRELSFPYRSGYIGFIQGAVCRVFGHSHTEGSEGQGILEPHTRPTSQSRLNSAAGLSGEPYGAVSPDAAYPRRLPEPCPCTPLWAKLALCSYLRLATKQVLKLQISPIVD